MSKQTPRAPWEEVYKCPLILLKSNGHQPSSSELLLSSNQQLQIRSSHSRLSSTHPSKCVSNPPSPSSRPSLPPSPSRCPFLKTRSHLSRMVRSRRWARKWASTSATTTASLVIANCSRSPLDNAVSGDSFSDIEISGAKGLRREWKYANTQC